MSEMKRNIKDSVFTCLFREPKYTRELYLTLHPEDTEVREDEIRLLTIANVLSNGMYNDLGMQVRDRLIILMESQTEFSQNIPLRLLFYLAETYKIYVTEHALHLHGSRAVAIPRSELYVLYTGTKADIPDVLRLSELCGGAGDVEVTVKVLRGDAGSIVGEYVAFCQITDQQRQLYGRTREAIKETIRICQERNILVPFLTSRRKEVISMMEYIFNQEEIWAMDMKAARRETGSLYRDLMRLLLPLGRVAELDAAVDDDAKLLALTNEFGLTQKYNFEL